MLVMAVVMFTIVPTLCGWLAQNGHDPSRLRDTIAIVQNCNIVVMQIFVYAYVAFFGSCIASFLNVVAWRVPRGRSILGSSHCPSCDHRLSMRDNIPIWGWLKNEGRCRHCQASIAPRYFWVEIFLGCVFLILFVTEVVFGGFNLPTWPTVIYGGNEFVQYAPNMQLIRTFAFHATLMSVLFTIAIISSESLPIPLSLVGIAAVILIGIAFFYPIVLQVSWYALTSNPRNDVLASLGVNSALTMLLGLVAGAATGSLAAIITGKGAEVPRRLVGQPLVASFALMGLALGWQSVLITLVIWLPLATIWIKCAGSRRNFPVMPAALLHILSWSLIFSR